MTAPATGWTTHARITDIVDGDTLDLDVSRHVRVRLLDCWAPESRTTDAREKARGQQAAAYLEQIALGRECVLHIPSSEDLKAAFSFGRVLGRVWLPGDLGDLSEAMVAGGFATRTKESG